MSANGEGKGEGKGKGNSNNNTLHVVGAGRESFGQTNAKEGSRSRSQEDADAMASKWKQVSSYGMDFGLGGNMFSVNHSYADAMASKQKQVSGYGVDFGAGVDMFSVNHSYADAMASKQKQVSGYGVDSGLGGDMSFANHSYADAMASKWKQVSGYGVDSGMEGDMVFVNHLYIPRTPAEEKAQLHQALYESQRTARKQIDGAGSSRVMEDAAKTHSDLHHYVLEKEARLQWESSRQTTAKKRSRSPCQRDTGTDLAWNQKWVSGSGVGGDMLSVNHSYIPHTPAEEQAQLQLHQALYESQRTTRKCVEDAGPSRAAEDADKEDLHSCRCHTEKEEELLQALHKVSRTLKEVRGSLGPSIAVEDLAKDVNAMSEFIHSAQGNQNVDNPSTLQLSTQVHEDTQNIDAPYTLQLSLGLSITVEDAAKDVYAMSECIHSAQGNRNVDNPSTLQLRTQVHEDTQNTDDPYTLQLSTLVHEGTQNIDDSYTLQLSTQVHEGTQNTVNPVTLWAMWRKREVLARARQKHRKHQDCCDD